MISTLKMHSGYQCYNIQTPSLSLVTIFLIVKSGKTTLSKSQVLLILLDISSSHSLSRLHTQELEDPMVKVTSSVIDINMSVS